jgi:hypothetical protein
MSETERDSAANYRKPALHTRFKKGRWCPNSDTLASKLGQLIT